MNIYYGRVFSFTFKDSSIFFQQLSLHLKKQLVLSKKPEKIIYISVTNDLVSDQRVHRIALTLIKSGAAIMLIGRKLKDSLSLDNRPYHSKRFKLIFNKGVLFYATYNIRLFFYLLFKKPDIIVANDLDTLLANFLISRIKNKPLVYDSHEYFTEVPELINRKTVKNIWTKIEKHILPKIKYSYTVCDSIASIYNEQYGINMKVVRNLPLLYNERKKEPLLNEFITFNNKNIILYQGSINVGRGLELVINSMKYIENTVFVIIGKGDITGKLKTLISRLSLEDKVHFIGQVPLEQLHKYTIKAHVGISLEENTGLNYYYSLPNKLFDYIQANVPVLASSFPEIKKIINKYDIGIINNDNNPEKVAENLTTMLNDEKSRIIWKKNLQKAAKELCWENEEKVVIDIYGHI